MTVQNKVLPVLTLLVVLITSDIHAGVGIDKVLIKPSGEQDWGTIVSNFVQLKGLRKSYALVVGISDYTGDFTSLPTRQDAIRIAKFLHEEAGFDQVHVLTEEKATKKIIEELMLEYYPQLVEENDRFLFYWSGHGIQRSRKRGSGEVGYLPLTASKKQGYASMIAMEDVSRWNRHIESRQSLFLLDACFSGLAGTASKGALDSLSVEQYDRPSHHLLSAGTGDEKTIASDKWGGSLFTDAVLEGMRGKADSSAGHFPQDGLVSLSELISYVKKRVAFEKRAANWRSTLTPQLRDLSISEGEFFFVTSDYKLNKQSTKTAQYDVQWQYGRPVSKGATNKQTLQQPTVQNPKINTRELVGLSYLESLVSQMNSPTKKIRLAATHVIKNKYANDIEAVGLVLAILSHEKISTLSPQAKVNALFYLANTQPSVWSAELKRKGSQSVNFLRRAGLGPQSKRQLEIFARKLH